MNLVSRVILTVYMLIMVFISIAAMILPFNILPFKNFVDLLSNESYKWYYSLIGFLFFIVSIKLLISGITSDNRNRRGIVKAAEFGDIKISVETFEALSMRVVKQVSGIKDIKVKVDIVGSEIVINGKLLVLSDVNIPKVVGEVQAKIKEYIESITEINVKEVKISVDNVAQTSSTRIE